MTINIFSSSAVTSAASVRVAQVSVADFVAPLPPLQYPETPTSAELVALLNSRADRDDIDDFIYTSPLNRSFSMPVGEDAGGNKVVHVKNQIDYVYNGPLAPAQYQTFAPQTLVRVFENDTLRLKRVNNVGSPINVPHDSASLIIGGTGGTGGVSATDLANAIAASEANFAAQLSAAISNEVLARNAAINNNPNANFTEIILTGSNAPAIGVIPPELTNLPATDQEIDDIGAVVFGDFRVLYEVVTTNGNWTETDRVAVASPSSTLTLIGGAGNDATFGWYQSPTDPLVYYPFAARLDNPNLDLTKNITDSDAHLHFTLLERFTPMPFEASIAHFYVSGTSNNTSVMVGRKRYYLTGSDAEKLVQPVDNNAVNTIIAGWEYTGVE